MSEPVRVLHILQKMEAAGIQTLLMNIYRRIDRSKVQFDFLVQYKEDQFYDQEVQSLGGHIYKFSVREDYNTIKYRKQIRRFFSEHREYKVIHGHMETFSNIWEEEASRARIPVIITHSHTAGFNEKNKIKLFIKEYYRKHYGVYATHHFACSKAAGEFMFGYKNKDYQLIPNEIDIEQFRFDVEKRKIRESLDITNQFVVGHVGRFHPSKNHFFMLQIVEDLKKIIPNFKTVFIGDGDLRKEIEKIVTDKGLNDTVLFLGNRKDVSILYSALDAFIMPSLYEGLPLVGVEAQASGVSCLFSDKITEELKVTNNVVFLPINDGPDIWVEKLVSISKQKCDKAHYADEVKQHGYDINDLVNWLQNLYITAYEENRNA